MHGLVGRMAKDVNERFTERRRTARASRRRKDTGSRRDDGNDTVPRHRRAVVAIEIDRAQQPQSIGAFVVCAMGIDDAATLARTARFACRRYVSAIAAAGSRALAVFHSAIMPGASDLVPCFLQQTFIS
jgi:hypothetical protein